MTKAQRAREQALMDAAREQAERFEYERRMAEEAARREEEARLAARPLGVRLVERRCGPCHDADFLGSRRYGRPGWWATVLRMEWFNGARFEAGERGTTVMHLATTQPASPARMAVEWGLTALAVALPLAGWIGLRHARATRSERNA